MERSWGRPCSARESRTKELPALAGRCKVQSEVTQKRLCLHGILNIIKKKKKTKKLSAVAAGQGGQKGPGSPPATHLLRLYIAGIGGRH